jgi:hypothetical protein
MGSFACHILCVVIRPSAPDRYGEKSMIELIVYIVLVIGLLYATYLFGARIGRLWKDSTDRKKRES